MHDAQRDGRPPEPAEPPADAVPLTPPDTATADAANTWPAASAELAPPLPDDEGSTAAPHARIPGPGLVESVFWTLGVLLVHVVGGIVALAALMAAGALSYADVIEGIPDLRPAELFRLISIEQAVFVLLAVVAVALRLSGGSAGRLSLRPVAPLHALIILALIVPVVVLPAGVASALGDLGDGSAAVIGAGPVLLQTDIQVMELVGDLIGEVSFPLLVLVIALAPAIGEEVVFRGLIGRGLVARWGIPVGVVLTALLFAAAHVQPAHAVRVIPLGIVIHLVYLATRTFWAPVLYHFLNNGMALLALKAADGQPGPATLDGPDLPAYVFVTALLCVTALVALLWRTRVQYRLPDGTLWDPGYPTPERPPRDSAATAERRKAGGWLTAAVAGSLLLFWSSLLSFGAQAAGR